MKGDTHIRNAVDLHREMYEQRCREVKLLRGETQKQVFEHTPRKQPKTGNNSRRSI